MWLWCASVATLPLDRQVRQARHARPAPTGVSSAENLGCGARNGGAERRGHRVPYRFVTPWKPTTAFFLRVNELWPTLAFVLDYEERQMAFRALAWAANGVWDYIHIDLERRNLRPGWWWDVCQRPAVLPASLKLRAPPRNGATRLPPKPQVDRDRRKHHRHAGEVRPLIGVRQRESLLRVQAIGLPAALTATQKPGNWEAAAALAG